MSDELFPSWAGLPTNEMHGADLRVFCRQPGVPIFVHPVDGFEPKFPLLKVAFWDAKELDSVAVSFGTVAASHDDTVGSPRLLFLRGNGQVVDTLWVIAFLPVSEMI